MAEVSLDNIKKLREETSAGISNCKKALTECQGNFEEAKNWLKQKGLSIAKSKADRVAAEGLVSVNNNCRKATIIEVNAETDFVANNQDFINFVANVSSISTNCSSLEDLKDADYGNGNNVASELLSLVAKVQENLVLRKFESIEAKEGKLYHYVHSKVVDNVGRIVVVVNLKGEGDLKDLGKGIAMHVAGFNPAALDSSHLDKKLVEKERALIAEELKSVSDKPQEIINKMLEGKMRKFFKEVCLVEQNYLLNDKKTIAEVLKENQAEIISYKYLSLGEDIEKKEDNFADEVSKIING